jgi:rhodanese-related sulfurtransferase
MPAYGTISPAQLARLIGTPEAPLLIDVRTDEDFAADPRLLPGARRAPARSAADLAPAIGPRGAVVICQRGLKLSEGAAALLRTAGATAENLEGGWLAAVEAGLPTLPAALVPGPGSLWVTRHRPKIDRIACPWLIRRFIDPQARFLYVAPSEVLAVAERFDATPYDIEGVTYSHRGALCSFDAFLDDFGLRTEALDRLSVVVRGADTDRHDLAPQAAGLLAVSVGLSRQYRDDLAQLEAGMALYDALYRWARDGFDEGHDWPAGRKA